MGQSESFGKQEIASRFPDGRPVHDMYVFQVKSPAESKEPFDYYETVGVVKGEDAFQPLAKSRCPLLKKPG